jgi:hypothetical protein
MKHPTHVFLSFSRSRRIIIVITIALLGLTALLVAFTSCSPYKGTDRQLLIKVTTPADEDDIALSVNRTSDVDFIDPSTTHMVSTLTVNENAHLSVVYGKAKVLVGPIDYQIKGGETVSVGTKGDLPIGSDVRIWNNNEIAHIELEDGTVITLNPFTTLNIIIIKPSTKFPVIRILLGRGSILVATDNIWIISADYQFRIWVKDSTVEVSYKPLQSTITVNCLGMKGSCSFFGSNNWYALAPGQQLVYKGSIQGNIGTASFEERHKFEQILPTPTLTPTPTGTPTLISTPTPGITPTIIPTTAAPTHRNPDNSGDDPRKKPKGRDGGDGGKGS